MVLLEYSHLRWYLDTYRFIPYIVHVYIYVVAIPGPSPRIEKWSGGGSHRVPKAREGESMRRGLFPSR